MSSGKSVVRLVGALLPCVIWGVVASTFSDARPFQAAETMGFTEVRLEDSSIWFPLFRGCGMNDMKIWYLSGVNATGERHSFIVCGGMFKGDTIRTK